jgi:hypothetical protein
MLDGSTAGLSSLVRKSPLSGRPVECVILDETDAAGLTVTTAYVLKTALERCLKTSGWLRSEDAFDHLFNGAGFKGTPENPTVSADLGKMAKINPTGVVDVYAFDYLTANPAAQGAA